MRDVGQQIVRRTLRQPLLPAALACWAWAAPAATLVTSSVDGGGGRSAAGAYANDGCVGGFGGEAAAGASAARHGFAGQLTEPVSVAVMAEPASVAEGGASQLAGAAALSDDTVVALAGGDLAWGACAFPLASVSQGGLVAAADVYSNTAAAVSGAYLGVSGAGTLWVLDALPDNYGSYASDGVPDGWQALFFGLESPEARADRDPDGDGQDNRYEWTALTDPTNGLSRFRLRIEAIAGEPSHKRLVFGPVSGERAYTPLFATELAGAAPWATLTTLTTEDAGGERRVTDTDVTASRKFYRVRIDVP